MPHLADNIPHPLLYMNNDYVQKNPETVQHLANASY